MIKISARPHPPRPLDNLLARPPFFQVGNDRDLVFTIRGLKGKGLVTVELLNVTAHGPAGAYEEKQSVTFDATADDSVTVTFPADQSRSTKPTDGRQDEAASQGGD